MQGGILKKAQESLAAMGVTSSPQSAPAKLQKQQQILQHQSGKSKQKEQPKSAYTTPLSSPRAKAELFF